MIDYGKAIKKGLDFGVKPKRWLQFFFMDLAFFTLALAVILPNLFDMSSFLSGAVDAMGFAMTGLWLYLMVIFAVWMLVRMWFTGAIVEQSHKGKDRIIDTYKVSCRKYIHIILAMVIVTIVVGGLGSIYYVGWIISIFLGLVFFFVIQGIIVSKLNFWKTIVNSYNIFRKYPLHVFLAWLLITIVTMVVYLVFSIPAMVLFFWLVGSLAPLYAGAAQPIPADIMVSMMQAFQANIPALIVVGIIALAGLAISQTFSLKAQTEFYLQMKKKK